MARHDRFAEGELAHDVRQRFWIIKEDGASTQSHTDSLKLYLAAAFGQSDSTCTFGRRPHREHQASEVLGDGQAFGRKCLGAARVNVGEDCVLAGRNTQIEQILRRISVAAKRKANFRTRWRADHLSTDPKTRRRGDLEEMDINAAYVRARTHFHR